MVVVSVLTTPSLTDHMRPPLASIWATVAAAVAIHTLVVKTVMIATAMIIATRIAIAVTETHIPVATIETIGTVMDMEGIVATGGNAGALLPLVVEVDVTPLTTEGVEAILEALLVAAVLFVVAVNMMLLPALLQLMAPSLVGDSRLSVSGLNSSRLLDQG